MGLELRDHAEERVGRGGRLPPLVDLAEKPDLAGKPHLPGHVVLIVPGAAIDPVHPPAAGAQAQRLAQARDRKFARTEDKHDHAHPREQRGVGAAEVRMEFGCPGKAPAAADRRMGFAHHTCVAWAFCVAYGPCGVVNG